MCSSLRLGAFLLDALWRAPWKRMFQTRFREAGAMSCEHVQNIEIVSCETVENGAWNMNSWSLTENLAQTGFHMIASNWSDCWNFPAVMAITWKQGFTCKVAASSTLVETCNMVIAAGIRIHYPSPKCETVRRTRHVHRIACVTGKVAPLTFSFRTIDTCHLVDSCKQQQQ